MRMNSLYEAFYKMKNRYPGDELEYREMEHIVDYYISIDLRLVLIEQRNGIALSIYKDEKCYEYMLESPDEAYFVMDGFRKGKIRCIHNSAKPKSMQFKKLLLYRVTRKSAVSKILLTLFGSLIILSSLLAIFAGIASISRKHFVADGEDIALFLFFALMVYGGISLILAGLGRYCITWPVHLGGVIIAGLGIAEIIFSVVRLNEGEKPEDVAGVVLIFMMILSFGIFLIVISFNKLLKIDVDIVRTPLIPNRETMNEIFRKAGEAHGYPGYRIGLSNEVATYSGSRAGGLPYYDASMKSFFSWGGNRLLFLFQVNLSELQNTTCLPGSGMLQFFAYNLDGTRFDIKVIYYPEIADDNLQLNEERFDPGQSVRLNLTYKLMPDMLNINLEDIYFAAAEKGIHLQDDLEYWELNRGIVLDQPRGCYLLGPPRLGGNESGHMADPNSRIRKPLLNIDINEKQIVDALYMGAELFPNKGLQVFNSDEGMDKADFSGVITIHDSRRITV